MFRNRLLENHWVLDATVIGTQKRERVPKLLGRFTVPQTKVIASRSVEERAFE